MDHGLSRWSRPSRNSIARIVKRKESERTNQSNGSGLEVARFDLRPLTSPRASTLSEDEKAASTRQLRLPVALDLAAVVSWVESIVFLKPRRLENFALLKKECEH